MTADRKAIADAALADRLWAANTRHNRRPKGGPTAAASPSSPPANAVPKHDAAAESSLDGVPPIAESLARKEAANAELAERKLAADKGAYLEVAAVRREQLKQNAVIQKRLLAIPSELATHLSREDHRRIAPIVKRTIRAALQQLADEDDYE